MNKKGLCMESVKKYISRSLKNKVRITKAAIIAFIMLGAVNPSMADTTEEIQKLKQEIEKLKAVILGEQIIIGKDANDKTSTKNSVVIGQSAVNNGTRSIVIGYDSKNNENATGNDKKQTYSIIVGNESKIEGDFFIEGATILGSKSIIKSNKALTIGFNTVVEKNSNNAIVLGESAKVNENSFNGIAIGRKVEVTGKGAVAIGNDGFGGKEPKTIAKGQATTALGTGAQALNQSATAIGQNAKAEGKQSSVLGYKASTTANSEDSIAIGRETSVDGKKSIAIGRKARVEKLSDKEESEGAIAIGTDDTKYRNTGKENGDDSYPATLAKGLVTTAIGAHAQAKEEAATAIGARAFAHKKESAAFGANSRVKVEGGVAVGSYSLANRDTNGVKYYDFINNKESSDNSKEEGKQNTSYKLATKSAFSIGNTSKGYTRQLIGLAAGSEDTDAVNVWQLKNAMEKKLTFGATFGSSEKDKDSNKISKKLGETIYITADRTELGTLIRSNDVYTGDNLATYVKEVQEADGSKVKKIFIGMKQDSKFKSLVIGQTYGKTESDGKGKITSDDKGLQLSHDKATITISKANNETENITKAKISGLKNNDVTSKDYGKADSGIAATQKEVKDVLDKTQKLENGTAGTLVYTDKDGNKLMKEGNDFFKVKMENGKETKGVKVETKDIVLSTVNADGKTTTPTILNNISSALELGDDHKVDASDNDDKKAKKLEKLKEKIVGSDENGGLLTQTTNLNRAVNLEDLQALARLGMYLKGNNGDPIQQPLGTTFKIEGHKFVKPDAYNKDNYSSENLATTNDEGTLRIQMKKVPTFEKINIIKKADPNGGEPKQDKNTTLEIDDKGNVTITKPSDNGKTTTETLATNNSKISYKASKEDGTAKDNMKDKSTTLTDGFNFKDTENITAEVGDNGEIKHSLNKNLKNMSSIESEGEDTEKVKLTLEKGKGAKFEIGSDGVTTNIGKDGISIGDETKPDIALKVKDGKSSIDFKENGAINNLVDRKASDTPTNDNDKYGEGSNVGRAATEGAVKELYDKIKDTGDNTDGKDGKKGTDTDSVGGKGATGKDGQNGKSLNDKVNALRNGEAGTVVFTDKDGNRLAKANDGKYYKVNEVKPDGSKVDNATEVKNPELRVVNANGETTKPTTLNNIASSLDLRGDKAIDKNGAISAVKGLLKESDKNNLGKASNKLDLQALAQAGLQFSANKGNVIQKSLGAILSIKGEGTDNTNDFTSASGNILVESDGKDLTVKLSNKLNNLEEVNTKVLKVGDATITTDNDKNLVVDKKITGLKDGSIKEGSTDAITGGQLHKDYYNKSDVDGKLAKQTDEIQKANEKSNLALGGVSNAVAMANLVQVSSNSTHRHNLSAAYGYYGGSHSLAIGFSGISKNNNFIYKLSGAVNNQGNLALGIGAGIMLGEKNDYKERKDNILLKQELEEYKKKQAETDKKIKELESLVKKLMNK